jgi:phage terminase large subunit
MIVKRPKNIEEVLDGIETVRRFLASCWIDSTMCAQGIRALDNYHREFDEVTGKFKATPLHNWASDAADSIRTGATGYAVEQVFSEADLYPESE